MEEPLTAEMASAAGRISGSLSVFIGNGLDFRHRIDRLRHLWISQFFYRNRLPGDGSNRRSDRMAGEKN